MVSITTAIVASRVLAYEDCIDYLEAVEVEVLLHVANQEPKSVKDFAGGYVVGIVLGFNLDGQFDHVTVDGHYYPSFVVKV